MTVPSSVSQHDKPGRPNVDEIQVVNSSIHPDTGRPVPLPFRMSAFVPTNLM